MTRGACVAASSVRTDPDGVRAPAGEVHGWVPGQHQTVCGVPLSRARLAVFPRIRWDYGESDVRADPEQHWRVCERCRAALAPRPVRGGKRTWTRTSPRP